MSEYKFYVYNNKARYYKNFEDARESIKHIYSNDYLALGVTKDGLYSCDLLIKENGNYRISLDYQKLENFSNDGLIANNTIQILKREFNL
jgi:hypothetical protein